MFNGDREHDHKEIDKMVDRHLVPFFRKVKWAAILSLSAMIAWSFYIVRF